MKQLESTVGFTFGSSGKIHYKTISDFDKDQRLDTKIDLDGVQFHISGADYEFFKDDFENLIKKYFI